jgi:hypothetical protein
MIVPVSFIIIIVVRCKSAVPRRTENEVRGEGDG